MGAPFGPKIDLGCDLKSPFQTRLHLILLRNRFGTPFEGFLRPPGRSKTRKIRQEENSISEPWKPSKSLIFPRKITILPTSRDVIDHEKGTSSAL